MEKKYSLVMFVNQGRYLVVFSRCQNIPLGQIALRKRELEKEKSYVVVCQSGNRSKAACGILGALGFKVEDMIGGMNGAGKEKFLSSHSFRQSYLRL